MQLQRLTGLERQKILDELAELVDADRAACARSSAASASSCRSSSTSCATCRQRFGDDRRTTILDQGGELSIEDLIADEDVAITVTDTGYIKRTPISTYRNQKRGGKGRIGMRTRDEDVVNHLFVASTHAYMMVFSDRGRAYWLKVHEIPDVGADGRGKAIANLVQMAAGEKIAAMLPVGEFDDTHFIVMGTRSGTDQEDRALGVQQSARRRHHRHGRRGRRRGDGGAAVRWRERDLHRHASWAWPSASTRSDVRSMGRTAYGVRGIQLREGDEVVAMEVVKPGGTLLTVTAEGLRQADRARRIPRAEPRRPRSEEPRDHRQERPGRRHRPGARNEELLVITQQGKILRTPAGDIRTIGRATQGVRVMDLDDDDSVVSVALVERDEEPTCRSRRSRVAFTWSRRKGSDVTHQTSRERGHALVALAPLALLAAACSRPAGAAVPDPVFPRGARPRQRQRWR